MAIQGVISRKSILGRFCEKFPVDGGFTYSFNNCCTDSVKFSDSLCYNSVVSRRFGIAGSRKLFNVKGFDQKKFGGAINIRAEIDESGRVTSPAELRESFLSRSQTHAFLKRQMRMAALSEDYEEAARIRDSLKSLEDQEPALRLQSLLKKAISEERFEDAAHYRNELQLIAPDALLKCFSDTTTLGIRVQVRSIYVSGRSEPSKGQYFFAYRIRISNLSNRPVQLLRRHWSITDATGKTEHIWGVGVIGEQPVVLPRTSFEYSSACPLGTATGRMEGDFEMKYVDKVNSDTFSVLVGPFALSVDGDEDAI